MAFPRPYYLTEAQIRELLGAFGPEEELTITRLRYKNKIEIRRLSAIKVSELMREILEGLEEGWAGNFKMEIPNLGKTLIGHHDGVYWLEPRE